MATQKTTQEETFKVTGETLLKTVKDLIAQGNVRHITIKDKNEKVIAEFPLTVGVVATALLPIFAAVAPWPHSSENAASPLSEKNKICFYVPIITDRGLNFTKIFTKSL